MLVEGVWEEDGGCSSLREELRTSVLVEGVQEAGGGSFLVGHAREFTQVEHVLGLEGTWGLPLVGALLVEQGGAVHVEGMA